MASKRQKKKKGNKICSAGISWAKRTFLPILQHMQIWLLVSIVRILIMQKEQKRKSNG